MRLSLVAASAVIGLAGFGYSAPANAIGCITGGAAGAVAGHAVHHGVLGAVGGCVAGHEYNKHQKRLAKEKAQQQQGYGQPSNTASTTVPPEQPVPTNTTH